MNSLGPSDTFWRHRSGSTLAQIMACCLATPSHYLNQCILWHSPMSNLTVSSQATVLYNEFENCTFEITATSPRQWVDTIISVVPVIQVIPMAADVLMTCITRPAGQIWTNIDVLSVGPSLEIWIKTWIVSLRFRNTICTGISYLVQALTHWPLGDAAV